MIVIKIVGFGILASLVVVTLKEQNSNIAFCVVIASSVMLLLLAIKNLIPIISLLNNLIEKTPIEKEYIQIILKVIAIAYLIEFGKDICADAGQNAIANKIEIAGKVIIVSLSLPVIASVLEMVKNII